jgi:hypothetical protein
MSFLIALLRTVTNKMATLKILHEKEMFHAYLF